jgi:hypothetical protein
MYRKIIWRPRDINLQHYANMCLSSAQLCKLSNIELLQLIQFKQYRLNYILGEINYTEVFHYF